MPYALILCRFAHFASAMALFGASTFVAALAPPRLAGKLRAPMSRVVLAATVVAFASCVAWLMIEAGEMGEGWSDAVDPGAILSVLSETAFGRVWIARLALSAALLVIAIRFPLQFALIASVSCVYLASLGLVDHASMRQGAIGALERANQATHLLSGGFWLGSLGPLLICLPWLRNEEHGGEAAAALRRFSGLGHFAVAAVLATGVVNILVILGGWPSDIASPYQSLLIAKIALVATMAIIAIFNRYILAPRLALGAGAIRRLAQTTFLEIALGGGVLALVSAFGTFEPI